MTAPVHPGGWVDGIGWVALGSSLGPSDLFARWQGDPPRPKHPYRMCDRTPVIVTCWADGTVPTWVPSHPDSIQFRLRQFTPHHPVASGRQAMMDAADALDVTHCADGSTPQAPTVDSVPDAVKLLADLANDGGTESIPSVDVCGFCWDSECDGIGCIANLDPDCADDHPKIERLHALLRAGHALRAAAGVDWNDERDAAATGCGYYPATPSPVQDSERPDTEELRSLASFMEGDDDARLIRAAADWIESAGWMWIKPAADQGPDLSEAVALLDEYDQSVHNLTRFGTVEAQTDHLLASERVAAFARRLLDREGGT